MKIRTFRANSLQEALRLVREKLGPDAAVLHTRKVHEKRNFGLSKTAMIEVEASVDFSIHSRFDKQKSERVSQATSVEPPADFAQYVKQLGLSKVACEALWEYGAPEQILADENPESLLSRCRESLISQLTVSGELSFASQQPTIVAFVGPAGVGKTTALTKLAYRCRKSADGASTRIGLMTIDTQRPGAVDQLLEVAEHLSADLEVVSSVDGIPNAMERLTGCEIVLVDTPGRSSLDVSQLAVIRECLTLVAPHSTQLVVSAWLSSSALQNTLHHFGDLEPTHLLLTKLEEAADLVTWLPWLNQGGLPISYCSSSQSAVGGFQVATREQLADVMISASNSAEQRTRLVGH